MAHYLAELIGEAENGSTATKRTKACKEAIETIIKIWDHRTSLSGEAYPLTKYKDVLKAIDRLHPGSDLFGYFGLYADNKRDQLAAGLFNGFSRLVIALLLMKIAPDKKSADIAPAAIAALTDTEIRVLTALQEWEKLFEPASKGTVRGRKSKKVADHDKVKLDEAAIQLIDNLTTTLAELRSELVSK
jgi:hypothetical protein